MKYQRGCDTWQATAKMVQPCIFLTKSHECTVNCAISSWNFSNHYIKYNKTQLYYIIKQCILSVVANEATTPSPFSVSCFGVSSDYTQPITGQVTEVTCPVIGRAQPELTPSKRQKRAQISVLPLQPQQLLPAVSVLPLSLPQPVVAFSAVYSV